MRSAKQMPGWCLGWWVWRRVIKQNIFSTLKYLQNKSGPESPNSSGILGATYFIFSFFKFYLAMQSLKCSLWDLFPLTRNRTQSPCIGSAALDTGPPGKSHNLLYLDSSLWRKELGIWGWVQKSMIPRRSCSWRRKERPRERLWKAHSYTWRNL